MIVKSKSIEECYLIRLENMETLALESYFQSGGWMQPDLDMTGIYEVQDTTKGRLNCNGEQPIFFYVRLANADGTLAVFRELDNGSMKRLKRWPRTVETGEASPVEDIYEALSHHKTDPDVLAAFELDAVASELAEAIRGAPGCRSAW